VLIPYPHAADDHQTANARSFVEVGGGWVIPQSDLSPDILAVRLGTLLSESAALIAAAERARSFSRRDATQRLARLVLDLEPHTDCGAGPPGRAA
jgi:UDP-N-acetylglucosamine--N-acetylmuramyl-(pentapeptide) pyrophosphoryl-undecaprenol N-acetylglucosamine transferase